MFIVEDYHYISDSANLLIKKGFGKISVHSYKFDRYFSEEQKAENRRQAELLGTNTTEWSDRCDSSHHKFYEAASKMMEDLGNKYTIYQYNTNEKEYDLFFYSNRGWNNREWYDHCELNLSKDYEQNSKQHKELLSWLSKWQGDTENVINCRIQYDSWLDKEAIEKVVNDNIDKILDKKVLLGNREGKIKWVECNNEYGFFKKGARKYYTKLNNVELLILLIQHEIV